MPCCRGGKPIPYKLYEYILRIAIESVLTQMLLLFSYFKVGGTTPIDLSLPFITFIITYPFFIVNTFFERK